MEGFSSYFPEETETGLMILSVGVALASIQWYWTVDIVCWRLFKNCCVPASSMELEFVANSVWKTPGGCNNTICRSTLQGWGSCFRACDLTPAFMSLQLTYMLVWGPDRQASKLITARYERLRRSKNCENSVVILKFDRGLQWNRVRNMIKKWRSCGGWIDRLLRFVNFHRWLQSTKAFSGGLNTLKTALRNWQVTDVEGEAGKQSERPYKYSSRLKNTLQCCIELKPGFDIVVDDGNYVSIRSVGCERHIGKCVLDPVKDESRSIGKHQNRQWKQHQAP